jgi:hypothetical protein
VAFVHGKNSYFQVDDSGGTARNLTSFVDQVSGLPGGRELADVTAMGDNGHRYIPGLQNGQFSINGHYDPTATTGPQAVLSGLALSASATSTFNYGPEGSTAGMVKLTGECWCETYEVTSSATDKVSFTANFRVDGTVTVTTF